ncbi:MAG: hypothetical protein R2705_10715 [Ilumatobacteraceae bacterium]
MGGLLVADSNNLTFTATAADDPGRRLCRLHRAVRGLRRRRRRDHQRVARPRSVKNYNPGGLELAAER